MGYRDVAKVGLGGPVGSGKTALVQRLVPRLDDAGYDVGVIANDIMTQEDADRLRDSFADRLPTDLVAGVETGACPHTGIREDPSMNLAKIDEFTERHPELDVVLIESGGDNLAATFNPELADYFMFVISVAEGDDIPRKRGPGVTQADLLVVNKTDLAPHVDVDLDVLRDDAETVRGDDPTVFTNCKAEEGVGEVVDSIERSILFA
ncbi:urease accessory protein UreG [Halorubrum saccharovorum DSM 1137]|uniref:Urease accessory protein UreG n=1 Tax=Halorubrum saccharovorum DSM 1137 TaxID=1227484 RepID=M0E5G0_9EURY|nr:urease accessory protein UreG [Halorubrum saccharovorum]ELZ42303.1 urease accessory protein UreG [Halorubrum saccharovorum DSM 1137]